jgi:predicted transcriptional regulator
LSLQIEHKQKQEKEDIRIDWRRSKVQELSSQGHSQREIAQILQVSNGIINRDLSCLRQQAKSNIRRYIDERLPEEYEKCLVGFTAILREACNAAQQSDEKREKNTSFIARDCLMNE